MENNITIIDMEGDVNLKFEVSVEEFKKNYICDYSCIVILTKNNKSFYIGILNTNDDELNTVSLATGEILHTVKYSDLLDILKRPSALDEGSKLLAVPNSKYAELIRKDYKSWIKSKKID